MIFDTVLAALLALGNLGGAAAPASPAAEASPAVVVAQAQAPAQPAASAPAPAKKAAPAPAPAPAAKPGENAAAKPAEKPAKPAAPEKPQMAADVKALVDRMQAFYEGTSDFTSEFEQRYTYKAFKRIQVSTGTVMFKKPGLMRWEYAKPAPKTFVLAGDKVYAHDPEAMLLTRANINTNQLSASVTFLFGQGKLADEFSIEKTACTACKGTLLTLNPLQPDPRFKQILLEVDPRTAQVLKSTVVDPDGSENAITFKNLKTNVGLSAEAFKLSPPEGTQIQDYSQAKAP